MLEALIVLLIVLWLLGLVTQIGGMFVHALIVAALVVVAIRIFRGRNVV